MRPTAYGHDVNYEDIGRAIGALERTLVFIASPFRPLHELVGQDSLRLAPDLTVERRTDIRGVERAARRARGRRGRLSGRLQAVVDRVDGVR